MARFPELEILIYPSAVQGRGAEKQIAEGVKYFNRRKNVDVIVVTRGGGSLEDLWPFNEEIVARAIAASKIPVVSAVGHEIDFTIADFAADLRAPTPSGAAELIVPEKAALEETLSSMNARILSSVSLAYERSRRRLETLISSEPLRRPAFFVMEKSQQTDMLLREMSSLLDSAIRDAGSRYEVASQKLNAHSPFAILNRGYAMVFGPDGKTPLTRASDAPEGTPLTARLAQGVLRLKSEGEA